MTTATAPRMTQTRRPARATTLVEWRIESYDREDQPPGFAVYRGEERLAWGLRDHATAARWVQRLGGTAVLLPEADGGAARGAQRRGGIGPWWAE